MEIYCQNTSQKLNQLTEEIFLVKRVIYFWNKLPNQNKNSNKINEKNKIFSG